MGDFKIPINDEFHKVFVNEILHSCKYGLLSILRDDLLFVFFVSFLLSSVSIEKYTDLLKKYFRFFMYLIVTGCPQLCLTISGKCLSVIDTNFVGVVAQEIGFRFP